MTTLFEAVPYLAAYQPSFLVLGLLALFVLLQSFASAPLSFLNEEQVPGMPLRHDHSRLSFRALRAYGNAVENFPAFGWSLLVAIVAGTSPAMVNWLAFIYLAFRAAYAAVYYPGIGKAAGGPRTLFYVGSLLTNIALAGIAIYTLLV